MKRRAEVGDPYASTKSTEAEQAMLVSTLIADFDDPELRHTLCGCETRLQVTGTTGIPDGETIFMVLPYTNGKTKLEFKCKYCINFALILNQEGCFIRYRPGDVVEPNNLTRMVTTLKVMGQARRAKHLMEQVNK